MSVARLLRVLGGVAIVVGLGAIAYAHLAVAPELHRSVDVARQAVNDGEATLVLLSQTVETTEELRPPTQEITRRNLAVLKSAIALLETLPDTLRLIPGAGGTPPTEQPPESARGARPAADLPSSLAKVGRAVGTLTEEARGLRKAALALEVETDRHPMPSLQPAVGAATARVRETQAILAESNPARNMTLLADAIAGIYLLIGATLLTLARAVEGTLRSRNG